MATSRYQGRLGIEPTVLALSMPEVAPAPRTERPPDTVDLELRVAALERERRAFSQDLLEAAHVQRRLSGPRQMRRGTFEIASEVFPVRHLAGDFVSAIDIGAHTWIALGDIAGKGIAAAMWFTHLVSLIRCHAAAQENAAVVMTMVNRDLCELRPTPPITTMLLLRLDWHSEELEYCNAGHPPALLLRRDSTIDLLETGGPVLGVVSGANFDAARVAIRPADLLLGCSDGLLECRNAGDEEFGNERLVCKAREHLGEPANAVLFSILGGLQDFAGGTPRQDDVSLLVIRRAEALSRAENRQN